MISPATRRLNSMKNSLFRTHALRHALLSLIIATLAASATTARAQVPNITTWDVATGTYSPGQVVSIEAVISEPSPAVPCTVVAEGTDVYGNPVTIPIGSFIAPALIWPASPFTAPVNEWVIPDDVTLHGSYAIRLYAGNVTPTSLGTLVRQTAGVNVSVPVGLSIPTGSLIFPRADLYGGSIPTFSTSIANGGTNRPWSGPYNLNTILSVDSTYQGTAGSDDFMLFSRGLSGDAAGVANPTNTIRSVSVTGTPGSVPTYGVPINHNGVVPTTAVAASGFALVSSNGAITNVTITNQGFGYTNANTAITFSGGSGAVGRVQINTTNNTITNVVILNGGANYPTNAQAVTVTMPVPAVGARYYTPQPDNGFLDPGETVTINYEVAIPDNYAAQYDYYVGAQVSWDDGSGSQANALVPDVEDRLTILSKGASPTTLPVSQASDSNGNNIRESNGNSTTPAVDETGESVVFASNALNLTPDTGNGNQQILLRNTSTRAIEAVSISSGGALANRDCLNPSITPDAKYVVFETPASNLVAFDTGLNSDIFVRDLDRLRTVRMSVNADGVQGDAGSAQPSISGDGRFVAFGSLARNLDKDVDPDDIPQGVMQIYVHDRDVSGIGSYDAAGNIATYLVSVNADGAPSPTACDQPKISRDGNYLAFVSGGLVYRMKLADGKPDPNSTATRLQLVSVSNDGQNPGMVDPITGSVTPTTSFEPAINGDGSQVAFVTKANNLIYRKDGSGNRVWLDTNGVLDVYVRNFTASDGPATVRVSESLNRVAIGEISFSAAATGGGGIPAINPQPYGADGEAVTITAIDYESGAQISRKFTFYYDPSAHTAAPDEVLVAMGQNGSDARNNLVTAINQSDLSRGLFAFITSPASGRPPGTANEATLGLVAFIPGSEGNFPILHELPKDAVGEDVPGVISPNGMWLGGTQADLDAGLDVNLPSGSDQPSFDSTGRYIAFRSTSQTLDVFKETFNGQFGLIPGEMLRYLINGYANVFVHDRNVDGRTDGSGAQLFDEVDNTNTLRASVSRFGYATGAASGTPGISGNGRYVAMASLGALAFGATNLDPQDTNGNVDIYLRDLSTNAEPPATDPNRAPEVVLTEPTWLAPSSQLTNQDGSRRQRTLVAGSKIFVNALVSDVDGTIDSVTFYINGDPYPGTKYGNFYTAEWTASSSTGAGTIIARATDDKGATTTTSPLNFIVGDFIPAPVRIDMVPLRNDESPTVGELTTLSARVSLPTIVNLYDGGVVFFYANHNLIGSVQVPVGSQNLTVSVPWYPEVEGTTQLTAIAATFNNFANTAGGTTTFSEPAVYSTLLSTAISTTVAGIPGDPEPGSNEAFVIDTYPQILGRAPTVSEYSFYLQSLDAGMSRSTMVLQLLQANEYAAVRNRIFDFYYRLGVEPTNVDFNNYSSILGNPANAAFNDTLLPISNYPPFSSPNPPFGSTVGEATVAQLMIDSPAFLNAWPQNPQDEFPLPSPASGYTGDDIRNLPNNDFLRLFVYPRMGGQAGDPFPIEAMMNTFSPPADAQGSSIAFLTAMYSNVGLLNGDVATRQLHYQYQLWASSVQWLIDGAWAAPTNPTVTNEAQLLVFISQLIGEDLPPAAPPTLREWATQNGLSLEQSAPDASPAGDGISNLLKYAFNMQALESYTGTAAIMAPASPGSPLSGGNSGLPVVYTADDGRLEIQYVRRRNASGSVTYQAQFSSNLTSAWEPATGTETVVRGDTDSSLGTEWERVTVRDTAPASTPTTRFARVKVGTP